MQLVINTAISKLRINLEKERIKLLNLKGLNWTDARIEKQIRNTELMVEYYEEKLKEYSDYI